MKQYTIELDEMVCSWLAHIAKITGEPVERIIANQIYHQIEILEDGVVKNYLQRVTRKTDTQNQSLETASRHRFKALANAHRKPLYRASLPQSGKLPVFAGSTSRGIFCDFRALVNCVCTGFYTLLFFY